jgi:hypothetical protein
METTYEPEVAGGIFAALGMFIFVIFGLVLFLVICRWKIYTKAGKPGWAAIIPIYNIIVLLEIVNKPTWWFLLLLVPIVNIVIAIKIVHRLSLAFGKDVGFTILLLLLPIIGYPMLAFGDAQYTRPAEA